VFTRAEISRSLPALDEDKVQLVFMIFETLDELAPLRALFLHGSHTRGMQRKDSDIDAIGVFGTIEEVRAVVHELPSRIRNGARALTDAYSERFPWFGRLWTFYFEADPLFAVDIGLIALDELATFSVEPDAVLLRDTTGAVGSRKAQCYRERLAVRRAREASLDFIVFHTLTKLEHALQRGHLWNAFEYVNILRRLLFESIRAATDTPEYVHVGRPERDIETAVPWVASQNWTETIPDYRADAIINAALLIVDRIRAFREAKDVLSWSELLDAAIARLLVLRDISRS